jgi:spermidine synthase
MAIKPSEIRSMRKPVSCVSGNVITFGLGLGYYTFMVSQKNEVEHITVVERDSSIIHLFQDYILPQFPHKEKVSIIQSDAFKYMKEQMPKEHFDYAFVDLWHDSSDGLPLYLKARKLAEDIPQTHFLYWVENTLRSAENWNQ